MRRNLSSRLGQNGGLIEAILDMTPSLPPSSPHPLLIFLPPLPIPAFVSFQLLTKFRRSADALAEINESLSFKDEDSIFSTLAVFAKYMEASRDMLYKRIGLLVEYGGSFVCACLTSVWASRMCTRHLCVLGICAYLAFVRTRHLCLLGICAVICEHLAFGICVLVICACLLSVRACYLCVLVICECLASVRA